MEWVSFEIERQEVADALHAEAEARGRSVEAELAALVEQTYAPALRKSGSLPDDDWVAELIRVGGGVGLRLPQWRGSERVAPAYPAGMEPLPDESFVDHITRISRPGIDLVEDRDRTPHAEPRL